MHIKVFILSLSMRYQETNGFINYNTRLSTCIQIFCHQNQEHLYLSIPLCSRCRPLLATIFTEALISVLLIIIAMK